MVEFTNEFLAMMNLLESFVTVNLEHFNRKHQIVAFVSTGSKLPPCGARIVNGIKHEIPQFS